MFILPPQKGYYFLGGEGGFSKAKHFKTPNWNSRGVGVLRLNPFCGRGMDDLCKYTKRNKILDPQFFLGCLADHFLAAYLIKLVWRGALVVRVISQENNTITLTKLKNLMV